MITSNKINNKQDNKQDNIQSENTLGQNAITPSNMTLDQIMDKTVILGSDALNSSEMDMPINNAFDKFAFMSNDLSNIMQKLPNVLCSEGTNCYKKKTENNLKEKYYLAKNAALTAPEDLRQAKKNYFIFLEGNDGWNKMEYKKYHKKAVQEKKIIETNHKKKIKQLTTKIKLYSNTVDYHKQLQTLIISNSKKNTQQNKHFTNIKDSIALNERKILYETEQNTLMQSWKNILRTIYLIIVLIYCYFFISKKLWKIGGYRNNYIDISLLILFILWPFISVLFTKYIFIFIHYLLHIIPIDTATFNYSS